MNIHFISYINSPAANPANHHAVSVGNPNRSPDADTTPAPFNVAIYAMSQWRQGKENEFMDNNAALFDRVNAVRKTKGTIAPEVYRRDRHDAKLVRQKAWIDYLAHEVCTVLEAKLNALEAVYGNTPNEMYVAALPEFFWRDINDHHMSDKSNLNYGMPFYDEVMNYFLDSGRGNNEFAQLTARHPNLIVFAGTIWWKRIDPTGETDIEEYQNMLAVFHSGGMQHTWCKQWVSNIDGAGSNKLSPSSINATGPDLPCVDFMGISFGMDICLDLMQGSDGTVNTAPLSKDVLTRRTKPMPLIQMLIAGGMPIKGNESFIYANSLLLRCDILPDRNGNFADMVGVGSVATPTAVSASAPILGECFFVFAPVDI